MGISKFNEVVTSAEELARVIGVPSELVLKKQLPELDAHMRRFIAESPFLLLGAVGRDGSCDVSPRGDAPGFRDQEFFKLKILAIHIVDPKRWTTQATCIC
jgi:hypothetical protein